MSDKLTQKQKKEWAKLLFTKEQLSQKEIAERVGVSAVTMNKWVKAENWDKLKVSLSITREEQLSNLYNQMAELNRTISERDQKYPTSAESDTINKLASAITKMETETGLHEIIGTSKAFLKWLREFDNEKAKELSLLFDDFITTKLRQ